MPAYVLRRGNRGADYARKPACMFYGFIVFRLEIEFIRKYRNTRSHFVPVSSKRMTVNDLLDVTDEVKIKI